MPHIPKSRGFSLLELLIYIAIFGTVVFVTSSMLVVILEGRDSLNSEFEVEQNIRLAAEKIRQLVYDSSAIATSGSCPSNTLEVLIGGVTSTAYISNGIFYVSSSTDTYPVTSPLVMATTTGSCLFTRIANASPAKPALQFVMTIAYNDNGNSALKFSDSIKSTVVAR